MGNSPWGIPYGESDSLGILHQFPNLSGARDPIGLRGITHGELSCWELMGIFPVNSSQN